MIENVNKKNKLIGKFCFDLFRNSKGDNVLVSPMSVIYCLGALMNVANGNTLNELEKVVGVSKSDLNYLFGEYKKLIENEINCAYRDKEKVLSVNNAFFFKLGFGHSNFYKEQFFDDYFGKIIKLKFDKEAVGKINNWASENTDHMINNILNEIPINCVMILVNTILFKDFWENKMYEESNTTEEFTSIDNSKKEIVFMHSKEDTYYEDEDTIGFSKYYISGCRFTAFLPKDKDNFKSFENNFDEKKYLKLISTATGRYDVLTSIPKFKSEYKVELNSILIMLGIKDLFNAKKCDLSGISPKNEKLFVSKVNHKTVIEVDENGTKASAETDCSLEVGCIPQEKEEKKIELNRPFIYILSDSNDTPIFIGKYDKA